MDLQSDVWGGCILNVMGTQLMEGAILYAGSSQMRRRAGYVLPACLDAMARREARFLPVSRELPCVLLPHPSPPRAS